MPTTSAGTGGPAEFARILRHKNTSQVSRWIKNPPAGWPEPVEWKELPSGRLRPIWRTADMSRFARHDRPKKGNRTDRGNRGRPASVPAPEEDPRVQAAAEMRRRYPEVTDAELIRRIRAEHDEFPDHSDTTWYRLLRTAGASRPDAPVHLPHAKAHPYEGDPRLTAAQRLLREHPDASDRTLAAELRRSLKDPPSERTLRKILHIARYIAPDT